MAPGQRPVSEEQRIDIVARLQEFQACRDCAPRCADARRRRLLHPARWQEASFPSLNFPELVPARHLLCPHCAPTGGHRGERHVPAWPVEPRPRGGARRVQKGVFVSQRLPAPCAFARPGVRLTSLRPHSAQYGFTSKSYGKGEERCVTVFKVRRPDARRLRLSVSRGAERRALGPSLPRLSSRISLPIMLRRGIHRRARPRHQTFTTMNPRAAALLQPKNFRPASVLLAHDLPFSAQSFQALKQHFSSFPVSPVREAPMLLPLLPIRGVSWTNLC